MNHFQCVFDFNNVLKASPLEVCDTPDAGLYSGGEWLIRGRERVGETLGGGGCLERNS